MDICRLDTIIGPVHVVADGDAVTHVLCTPDPIPDSCEWCDTPLLREAASQLEAYFAGRLRDFDLPLRPHGTPFMQMAWGRLREIPYGQTITYKQLAIQCGGPTYARAVGSANHRNPIPIVIPCHRVLGSNGQLTGFRGGLDMKRTLLRLEGHDL